MGQVIAALSISWVSRPNRSDIVKKYLKLAGETANSISRDLGYLG
jgi:DNA-binding IclR family transcriptional regulator